METVTLAETVSGEVIEKTAARIFRQADKDGNGELTKTETKRTIQKHPKLREFLMAEKTWKEFFKGLQNGDSKKNVFHMDDIVEYIRNLRVQREKRQQEEAQKAQESGVVLGQASSASSVQKKESTVELEQSAKSENASSSSSNATKTTMEVEEEIVIEGEVDSESFQKQKVHGKHHQEKKKKQKVEQVEESQDNIVDKKIVEAEQAAKKNPNAKHTETVELRQTMSEEAIEVMAERIFREADKDGNGILTKTETKRIIQKHPRLRAFLLADQTWKQFFAAIDKDGSNSLEMSEVVEYIRHLRVQREKKAEEKRIQAQKQQTEEIVMQGEVLSESATIQSQSVKKSKKHVSHSKSSGSQETQKKTAVTVEEEVVVEQPKRDVVEEEIIEGQMASSSQSIQKKNNVQQREIEVQGEVLSQSTVVQSQSVKKMKKTVSHSKVSTSEQHKKSTVMVEEDVVVEQPKIEHVEEEFDGGELSSDQLFSFSSSQTVKAQAIEVSSAKSTSELGEAVSLNSSVVIEGSEEHVFEGEDELSATDDAVAERPQRRTFEYDDSFRKINWRYRVYPRRDSLYVYTRRFMHSKTTTTTKTVVKTVQQSIST